MLVIIMTLSLQNQIIVPVYVKLAYTCIYNTYYLNTNVTVTDFIQNIKNSVYADSVFNISLNTPIEIVEGF